MRLSARWLITIVGCMASLVAMVSCESIDDDRIPPYQVYLPFASQAEWVTYGVAGALDHRDFIKSQRIPANYPYTAVSSTGFGGILLCADYVGNPVAYDLACPVECQQNIRIAVDSKTHTARCAVCGSEYDIYGTPGAPISGIAAERHYGLQVYHVAAGSQGQYRVITR